jgi:outer membrane receptor protein involved in Fe transport
LKLQANVLGTFVEETAKIKEAAGKDRQIFTPAMIASWQPWEKEEINFRAFYKRIFRMPTLNDLYYTFIGNASLNPEYTTQYNLGVTYGKDFPKSRFSRFETQIDVYYNEVKDKIVAMPTSNQFRWTMLNFGYVEIWGVDVSVLGQWRVASQFLLNGRLSYTYQKAQDVTTPKDEYYGGQIPYIPWHNGSVILNADYRKWSLNYSFIYTGERYDSRANIPVNHVQPWYTHDISLMKSFLWKNREMKLTAEVNNLLNQPYEVVRCYPMPGINFKFIIRVSI